MRSTLLILFSSITFILHAQSNDRLKVYLDCNGNCNNRYVRQNMTHVDYMQDRQTANVYIQVLSQRAGNGGNQYSMMFMGKEQFVGQNDTLILITDANDTENIVRGKQLATLKRGLLPYILQTSMAENITYEVDVPQEKEEEADMVDPWNAWVFRLNASGDIRGESNFNSLNVNGSINTSRVTEESKFFMRARTRRNYSEYNVQGEVIKNRNNSTNVFALYAKSLGPYWSVGGFASFDKSDFSNIDRRISIKPAIEYSVFPYDESATREFIFQYRIGPNINNYQEETIFDVTEEVLMQQNFSISYRLLKDWGDIGFRFNANNYLKDIDLSSVSFVPNVSWNVFRGFNLNFSANASYISDRINIRKATLTPEQILLGIRQLDTSFSYRSNFGVSYRFGSAINNVVNTRF